MKFLSAQISLFLQQRGVRRNMAFLRRFMCMLLGLIATYSILFHYIMELEGRSFSWVTGIYWTLTVMSTLGFGDITFTSDLGRFFSIVVLLSGVIFLLVMLPFTFIQYFYAPWLEAQKKGNAPRSAAPNSKNHVILVGVNSVALNLANDLRRYGVHCVLLSGETQTTLDLIDQGYEAVMGDHDDGETYRRLRLPDAAMLLALDGDVRNTSITFTARLAAPEVNITAVVQSDDAIDILQLAGCTHVFQFHKLLGEALARRVLNAKARCSLISQYGELVVAEAPVMRTPLVGQTLRDCGLRGAAGVNVVGIWERGKFLLPGPDMPFTDTMVMVLAGAMEQIRMVDKLLGDSAAAVEQGPVVILGGGRVGLAAARSLHENGRTYCLVEKNAKRSQGTAENIIIGDAADLEVLEKAGIRTAPSVLITTHDDDANIYLTLYCRRLRPDIQIISRATLDRNVGMLHAAGADLVLSLASLMTNSVINLLAPGKVLMLNEGLNIFRAPAPLKLAGKPLMGSGIRSGTHCSVVALRDVQGVMRINPEPSHVFAQGEELYLIGDSQSEQRYYEKFGREEHLGDSPMGAPVRRALEHPHD